MASQSTLRQILETQLGLMDRLLETQRVYREASIADAEFDDLCVNLNILQLSTALLPLLPLLQDKDPETTRLLGILEKLEKEVAVFGDENTRPPAAKKPKSRKVEMKLLTNKELNS